MVGDPKGKLAINAVAQDERMKALVSQHIGREAGLQAEMRDGSLPSIAGYLSKWSAIIKGGWQMRYFSLEDGVLSYYRTQDEVTPRGTINLDSAVLKIDASDRMRFEVRTTGASKTKFFMRGSHLGEVARWTQALRLNIQILGASDNASLASANGSLPLPAPSSSISSHPRSFVNGQRPGSQGPGISVDSLPLPDLLDSPKDGIPGFPEHEEAAFEILGNSARAELDTVEHLLSATSVSSDTSVNAFNQPRREALQASLRQLGDIISEYQAMTATRERYLIHRWSQEIEAKKLWEDTMQSVAVTQDEMERELQKAAKDSERRRKASRARRRGGPESPAVQGELDGAGAGFLREGPEPSALLVVNNVAHVGPSLDISLPHDRAADDQEDDELDNEDEFFDAIESGSLGLESSTPATPALNLLSISAEDTPALDLSVYKAYEPLRLELNQIDSRPPVSLWAILKSSIGKDLSRISFPVFFNEPTSMLQRMSEDMEFSECCESDFLLRSPILLTPFLGLTVDAAVNVSDQWLRMAHVAGFAISNYSSTIGRIAKPFNPMLGQTFENVRADRGFRYVSEQVSEASEVYMCPSHSHPPSHRSHITHRSLLVRVNPSSGDISAR